MSNPLAQLLLKQACLQGCKLAIFNGTQAHFKRPKRYVWVDALLLRSRIQV